MTTAACVHVVVPGLLTTVQDLGRSGWRRLGVGMAGALDHWSHQLANVLVGNTPRCATLEITLTGPTLRFSHAVRIALCGAPIQASVDRQPLPMARPMELPAGCELRLGACRAGARSYLAVAGGFATDAVMGSLSTDLRGGFGGMAGRVLRADDRLPLGPASPPVAAQRGRAQPSIAPWWVDLAPDEHPPDVVRVLPGSDATIPSDALCAQRWQASATSNRQGVRLQGRALRLADPAERISEPVLPGTVQLPPDGQPIVLLADAQTHGGYPRIAHAITADWPRLAQLSPGSLVSFAPSTLAQAHQALHAQHHRLARIALAVEARRHSLHR